MSNTHQTRVGAIAPARTLPLPLIEARAAAFDPLKCLDLTMTARRVLYGLLSFVNARSPARAVWPCRDLLRADALLGSQAALYRGLKTLEQLGYILREQIRVQRTGRFHVSPVRLTEKALCMLGLSAPAGTPIAAREKVIHKAPPVKVRDGQYKEHTNRQKQHSLQKSPAPKNSSAPSPVSGAQDAEKNPIDRATRLPVALLPMLSLGISVKGIAMLMGQATRAGKRLENVFLAAQSRLRDIAAQGSGRQVVAYLAALIRKDQDFEATARLRQRATQDQQHQHYLRERMEAMNARHDGYTLYDGNNRALGVFDARDRVIRAADGRAAPLNLRLMQWIIENNATLRPSPIEQ